jgi:hypothetical protein
MAFKAMNDVHRRRALVPFLHLANNLNAALVTFAVDKLERPAIEVDEPLRDELEPFWKPAVVDRLMWVIYLSAFLVSGLSAPGQDVMFIIDEDEVAANVPQLTKLTELFGRACSNQGGPAMGQGERGWPRGGGGRRGGQRLARTRLRRRAGDRRFRMP